MYLSDDEERRFVIRLFDYWHLLRGARPLPRLDDVNFNDFGKDAASCMLVDLAGGAERASFARVGLRLKPEGWSEARGRRVIDCPEGSLLHELLRGLSDTVTRRAPVSRGGEFRLRGRLALGRSILLPLAEDGEHLSHVLGGINFKFLEATGDEFSPLPWLAEREPA